LLPSDPVIVTWFASSAVIVKVDELPAAIDAGFALMLTMGTPGELLT
jgi:hypothetical protein